MKTTDDASFADLVEHRLGNRPPEYAAGAVPMADWSQEAQAFIRRMLALMKKSGYSPADVTPPFLRWLASIPGMLPAAWGGRIPPITVPNRHGKMDAYVSAQHEFTQERPPVFIDMGCGFPPVTTAETAIKLPQWRVYGVDRAFAEYIVFDVQGHYACFDRDGRFRYFQAFMSESGRALYADPAAAREHFKKLFAMLLPLLADVGRTASATAEKDGNRLIRHHIRDFKKNNLTFIEADMTELDLPAARVVRCMNVLLYFAPEIRKTMVRRSGRLLEDGGTLIAGTNGIGIQGRYAIYRKASDGVLPVAFAFSPDNLGPIAFMAWFTIHDHDPEAEMLAELAGAIRADQSFWPVFRHRVDELLRHHGICCRGSDGYLHFKNEMAPRDYLERYARLWRRMDQEGHIDGAVETLKKAGYTAWKNSVGDIAIRPSKESPLACSM